MEEHLQSSTSINDICLIKHSDNFTLLRSAKCISTAKELVTGFDTRVIHVVCVVGKMAMELSSENVGLYLARVILPMLLTDIHSTTTDAV